VIKKLYYDARSANHQDIGMASIQKIIYIYIYIYDIFIIVFQTQHDVLYNNYYNYQLVKTVFCGAATQNAGHGLLIHVVCRSHTTRHHSR